MECESPLSLCVRTESERGLSHSIRFAKFYKQLKTSMLFEVTRESAKNAVTRCEAKLLARRATCFLTKCLRHFVNLGSAACAAELRLAKRLCGLCASAVKNNSR